MKGLNSTTDLELFDHIQCKFSKFFVIFLCHVSLGAKSAQYIKKFVSIFFNFMNTFRNLCRFSGLAINEQDLSPSRGPNQHFLRDFERHLGPTQCGRPGGYDPQVWTLKLIFFQFAL